MSVVQKFLAYKAMGETLMRDPVGLAVIPVVLAVFAVKPVIVISGDMGFGGIVTAVLATCTFFTALVLSVGLLSAPAWGLFYAYRIGKDYGPETRRRTVEFFNSATDQTLDLDQLAAECGELPRRNKP